MTTSTLEVLALDASQAQAMQAMTFPAYRHLLNLQRQSRHRDEGDLRIVQPVALAALKFGQPVALAVLEIPIDARFRVELLSIFVTPQARRSGVATWLLAACEQFLQRLGHQELHTVYSTGKPAIEHFERLLARRNWQAPQTRMVSVRFALDRLLQADWINKYQPRPGYRLGVWSEVTPDEIAALRASDAAKPWIAPDLAPWLHDSYGYEQKTSVSIYFRDELVGWLINHQIDPQTVRYTCSFIRADLAKMGGILAAYVESFARSRKAGFITGTFVTPVHHQAMVRFAQRWFGPWASFFGETRGSSKQLDAQSVLAKAAPSAAA